MDAMVSGRAVCVEQDEEQVTYAQKLEKKDGYIDFEKSAERVHAHIRAVTSWPGAQCTIHIDSLKKAISVTMLPGGQGEPCDCPPGTVYLGKGGTIQIACTDVWYILGKVKPKGKAFMETSAFVNGYVREVPQGICGYVVRP